jgi:hypothetical protein
MIGEEESFERSVIECNKSFKLRKLGNTSKRVVKRLLVVIMPPRNGPEAQGKAKSEFQTHK